jgi:gliding motility-associated-like protein
MPNRERLRMRKFIFLLIALFFVALEGFSTHNRAGEITYRHISGLEYEITITTYTDQNMSAADRSVLTIKWGDGDSAELPRINGMGQVITSNIKKNIYRGTHVYAGPGRYILSMEDPNRVEGVINMAGSVNVPFYIETELIIGTFSGSYNNSPVLLNPPIDNACVDRLFIHNPGATDPDGDSLSYSLVDVRGMGGAVAPQYVIPGTVSINAFTGDMIWNTPQTQGQYNFAIHITEWRKRGSTRVIVGTVVRDLQVTVGFCTNFPPVIAALADTCVEAGARLEFPISATDQDNHNITLSANGGPFMEQVSPAQFNTVSGLGTVTGLFSWNTVCSHVRISPYTVFVKAVDDGTPNLSDYKSFNILVVGPAPRDPSAEPAGNSISVNWSPNNCEEVTGYRIFRRNGLYGFVPGFCETGVPAYTGYSQIASVEGRLNTSFIDRDLVHGQKYCYMIVAVFPDEALSYASVEVCAELKKDVPIITNVSVETTGNPGENYIAWSPPSELDTQAFPGPYYYRVFRSADLTGDNFVLIDSTGVSPNLNDTIYFDTTVNTADTPNSYKIELISVSPGRYDITGYSHTASSVRLNVSIVTAGNALNLAWSSNIPWTNNFYTIFRLNEETLVFDSIFTTSGNSYVDTGLVNGQSYCYYIRSTGAYSVDGIINPIVNLSQQQCAVPQDTEPPCPPVVSAEINSDCALDYNLIRWTTTNEVQNCRNDAVKYSVYFTPTLTGAYSKIAEVSGALEFLHQRENSIAGCYYVTATDIYGNESERVDTLCVDNCPAYELPNVFSPDGDNINDFFMPIPPFKFVESIDLQVFNRWGQMIFSTTEPIIMWNGVNSLSGGLASEGVYFYVCTVNEIRLAGITPRFLKGTIHLFRNNDVLPIRPSNR